MTEGDSADSTGATQGTDPTEIALDIIDYPEQLRGQTVYAGVQTGVIDLVSAGQYTGREIATELDLDSQYTHRLVRALTVYGLLDEDSDGCLTLTSVGERFLADHPESVRDLAAFFYHPARFAAIRHFSDVIAKGDPTGYELEYGDDIFEYCDRNPEFARHFNGFQDLMNTFGRTEQILDTLAAVDLSNVSRICDIGGGYGVVLCHLLVAHPHLEGTVLELPNVLEDEDRLWAHRLDVEDRCTYMAGDMFDAIPAADAYLLKDILHDWSDEDCIRILSNARAAATETAHLYVIERPLSKTAPEPEIVDMDMLMMLETGGRERTKAEYQSLFDEAGWSLDDVLDVTDTLSIMDCTTY